MMRVKPTTRTGRTVSIDTPYLKAEIVDGEVAVWEPREPPSAGLGDTIEKATSKLGIKSCGGCKRRRDKLNKAFPYKKTQE